MLDRVPLNYKELAFLLKKNNNNHSSPSDWWEYVKSCFKENARRFSKTSTTQEFQDWKIDSETYKKKKISNKKSNR